MLEQWADLKEEINKSKGLKSLSFHKLWARMLTEFSDEYPLVLRLVVIALLIPADTSECERVFSLMNDIKTSERSRLGQQNPKNLLLWHALATKVVAEKNDKLEVVGDKTTKLECKDVPVMAILKEFREMAGPKGRHTHHPAPKVTYEYEKHRQAVKVEA